MDLRNLILSQLIHRSRRVEQALDAHLPDEEFGRVLADYDESVALYSSVTSPAVTRPRRSHWTRR
jgi:hypothetical protein